MRRRKNFLPTLLLTILSWISLTYMLFFTAPDSRLSIGAFYLFLFLSLFLAFSLLLGNSRRGFLLAFGIVGITFLQQSKLLNLLNIVLLTGIFFSLELYFAR